MANTFALILALATLVTGVAWVALKYLHRSKLAALRETHNAINGEGLADKELVKAIKLPGWLDGTASLFPVLLLVFVVRSFLYEPFQIPSGSMMPTLLIGDFILVEKYAYGVKNPLTQETLLETGHPKRGDIAVFKYPLNPKLDYIKRIIGLPGDKVVYDPINKQLTVYPKCQSSDCSALPITYSSGEASEFVMSYPTIQGNSQFLQIPPTEPSDAGIRLQQWTETLDGVQHHILTNPETYTGFGYRQNGEMVGTFLVPEGHYFAMGDNRDNSADSRFWGFVPEKNLVGKAVAIWMSFDKQEGEWPTGVRLNRIGGIH